MVADAQAPCVAKTSAAMALIMTGPCLTRGGISTTRVLSMWRNDIKCKYMFMFSLKK